MPSYTNNRDILYSVIKNRILTMEYIPGQKISELEIAQQTNISRTPVREAFLRLSEEGLLQIVPQSGTYVSKIDLKMAEEARFVRQNIEKVIVANSCTHITPEQIANIQDIIDLQEFYSKKNQPEKFFDLDEKFHYAFYKIESKENTWNWLQSFNAHLNRFRWIRSSLVELDLNLLIEHHKEILNVVKLGDAQRAEDLVSEHLHLMVDEKDIVLKKYPDYF
ncbi:GntR family transcriptional regulator [Paenibacillus sp. 19GGS1-52]|uniref:GntR family transcriptional regulator n=1 Tax=Paenibacillus sp. 19GGS1-52 TaxID=2758563 RepID=UPI001EFBF70F|nr:GntR family transcriptional regulator [Paenibacillus sp. 19GGS1-52]ULO08792.1 GntR family transcriptional regulator [Paenibacillus sp. 19GGS1-52]